MIISSDTAFLLIVCFFVLCIVVISMSNELKKLKKTIKHHSDAITDLYSDTKTKIDEQ